MKKLNEKIKIRLKIINNVEGIKNKLYVLLYLFMEFLRVKNAENLLKNDIKIRDENNLIFTAKNNNKYQLWMYGAGHDAHVVKKIKDINPRIFFDVGANLGKISLDIAKNKNTEKVVAFEPENKNFKTLRENIDKNNIKNIYPLNMALSSKRGEMKLYLTP